MGEQGIQGTVEPVIIDLVVCYTKKVVQRRLAVLRFRNL
jgi:hypothetical protein